MKRFTLRRNLRPPPPTLSPEGSTEMGGLVAGLVSETQHRRLSGTQRIYRFRNNYGASVITDPGVVLGFLDGSEGDLELAVLVWRGEDYLLCYDTPITDDTIRGLTEEDVQRYLQLISQLPPES